MYKNQLDHLKEIKKSAESIRRLNLMSDLFVSVALEDHAACQYVIRKVLGTDDIHIISVKSQYRLLNLTSKDAILDVFARDSRGRHINIEIQRGDTVDHARRARYYGTMIDKSVLDKGAGYDELPDVYIIYISETDLWGTKRALCPVVKRLGDTEIPYDDGHHVIYVNAEADDGSEIARMMKYFRTADPNDMSQGELSERVRYLKTEKGGYEQMCEVAEKIFARGREEGVREGIERGIERGIEKGKKEGIQEGERSIIIRMYERGMSKEMIADASGVSLEVVSEWLKS